MHEIEIPFNDWSIERLSTGVKRATSRTKKYAEQGDIFSVKLLHGSVAWYQIKFVIKVPLWFVKQYLYKTEGCTSRKEFREIWTQIHPRRGWKPNAFIWYHYFQVHDSLIDTKLGSQVKSQFSMKNLLYEPIPWSTKRFLSSLVLNYTEKFPLFVFSRRVSI